MHAFPLNNVRYLDIDILKIVLSQARPIPLELLVNCLLGRFVEHFLKGFLIDAFW